LLQFIDPYEKDPDRGEPGRRWRAAELRLKSNEDLQKLWIVLLRERNMLHSTRMLHKKRKTKMPHLGRVQATRKSMAMIKVVLGERQRARQERDERLAAEHLRECMLTQIDLARSEVWPPFVPGASRELPLAAAHSFTILLRTTDGSTPEKDPPARTRSPSRCDTRASCCPRTWSRCECIGSPRRSRVLTKCVTTATCAWAVRPSPPPTSFALAPRRSSATL